jgi:hypothetical protein
MKVYLESVLDCPAEKIWDEVQKSSLLLEVIHPLARIVPVDAPEFPERWIEGTTVRCRLYLFGIIPMGTRSILFERIDDAAREIQTREYDPLISRWDHRIRVKPADDGRTHYSDEIAIQAGRLTLFVWLFARWFYRHRQKRWRRVAQRLAAASKNESAGGS